MKYILLVAASFVLSRAAFFLIDDPEGPNLLIVSVLAAVIFAGLLGLFALARFFRRAR